jgi:hypothetical protein
MEFLVKAVDAVIGSLADATHTCARARSTSEPLRSSCPCTDAPRHADAAIWQIEVRRPRDVEGLAVEQTEGAKRSIHRVVEAVSRPGVDDGPGPVGGTASSSVGADCDGANVRVHAANKRQKRAQSTNDVRYASG